MGRDLQKRKRRSSRQPIKQSQKTKKVLNPRGNTTIAQNWYALPLFPPIFCREKAAETDDCPQGQE